MKKLISILCFIVLSGLVTACGKEEVTWFSEPSKEPINTSETEQGNEDSLTVLSSEQSTDNQPTITSTVSHINNEEQKTLEPATSPESTTTENSVEESVKKPLPETSNNTEESNNYTYFDCFGSVLNYNRVYVESLNEDIEATVQQYALIDLDGNGAKELLLDYDAHGGAAGLYGAVKSVDGPIVVEPSAYSRQYMLERYYSNDGNGIIATYYAPGMYWIE